MDKPHYVSIRKLLAEPWIRSQLAPYRRYIAQVLAIMVATITINFTLPLTNRALVNQGILNGDDWFVSLIMGLQIAMYLSLIGLNAIRAKISGHVSNRLVTRMAGGHVAELINLPIGYFNGSRSGEIVERIRDLDRVQRFVAVEGVDALTATISIFSLSLLLLFIDVSIFLLFAGSATAYLGWIYTIGLRRRQTDGAQFEESSRARALEIGIVEGIQDIKIAGYESASLGRWAEIQIEALKTRLKATAIEQLQTSGGHFFTRAGMVFVTFLSAKRTIEGGITLGDFTITSVIIVQLYFHLNQILAFTNKLEEVRAAMHRTLEIRNLYETSVEERASRTAPVAWAPIAVSGVSFTYPGARSLSLDTVSFTIPEGQMTALIGPSGSGKTTILKLLLGIHRPSVGTITAAGADFARLDERLWLAGIGAVMQDGAMFAASIRDNICAGLPLDEEWLSEVMAASRLDDLLSKGDRGLETMIGVGGTHLSAGQEQRILVARALYKKPKLLLLDEATSALDGANEMAIVENIHQLLPKTTSVVAAHRLQTLRHATQVITLDAGSIVNIGSEVPTDSALMSLSRRDG